MGIARVVTKNNYKWYWVNMFGDKERSSDLMATADWGLYKEFRVTVTDPNGKPISKAKVVIFNKNRNKITQGKTNTKGKKVFNVEPKDVYYVRSSAIGYKYYTKRVKPGSDDSTSVKMWLEKE
jgi:hypothetical protein